MRACGARPSETESTPGHRPCGGRPEMTRRGVSLTDALCASAYYGNTGARAFHYRQWLHNGPTVLWGSSVGRGLAPITGVQSPTLDTRDSCSARWPSQWEVALERKLRENTMGDALGGAHSVRPRCRAIRIRRAHLSRPWRPGQSEGVQEGSWPNGGHLSVKPRLACGRGGPGSSRGSMPVRDALRRRAG